MNKEIKFANSLKRLRNKNKYTQDELAQKISVTRQTISTWENNCGKPDIYNLHDLCQVFDVSLEEMLYGKKSQPTVTTQTIYENNSNHSTYDYEEEQIKKYIKNLNKKGNYIITDEDLSNYFYEFGFDIDKIMTIAFALHKKSYTITELFGNGFSIYLKNAKEIEEFKIDLYYICDGFMHMDSPYENEYDELSEIMEEAIGKIVKTTFNKIYGHELSEFKYYWIDEEHNTRGYGFTKEECVEQAKQQECLQYEIVELA